MRRLRTMHLFAGAGGGILADILLGHQPVCAVEINSYCQQVLAARQEDGSLPFFPIFDDVTKFDGTKWRGLIDIVAGGFPCTDISVAGGGAGIEGENSGLWKEQKRIVCEVEPRKVYLENSPALTIRGLGVVLADLAELGFDAKWGVFSCADVGGVHLRKRIWVVATNTKVVQRDGSSDNRKNSQCKEPQFRNGAGKINAADNWSERVEGIKQKQVYRFTRFPWGEDVRGIEDLRNRPDLPEPLIRRINNDVAFGMDRLKAIGNGQVPRVAATAWTILNETKMNVHFSSKTDLWATPNDFFKKYDDIFHFTTDVCASHENAKCENYYSLYNDGLEHEWTGPCWMNPPYGREIGAWMKKAYESSLTGATVVCLVPSRTDTKWWHDYAMKGEIEFIKGRLKFGGHKNPAPFPSAVIIFNNRGLYE